MFQPGKLSRPDPAGIERAVFDSTGRARVAARPDLWSRSRLDVATADAWGNCDA